MGDWVKKNVLMKSKIFTIPTETSFKLSDFTSGVKWGNHVVEVGVTNMEQGFDTYSIETETVRTGDDTYYTRIWRQGVILNPTPNNYSIPYNAFGQVHTIVNEPNFGGISIAIQVYDCIPPLEIYVVVNNEYMILNQSYNYTSFSTTALLKVPAVDNFNGTVQVQLIPTNGQVFTATRADITFFKFYKTRNIINGTTNVIAYEV